MRLSSIRIEWRFLWGALFFLIFIFYFSFGEKIKPYAELLLHVESGDKANGSEVVDQLEHMLRNSFVDPLYGEELLYPAMSSLVEIDVAMTKNFVRAERIEDSYNDVSIRTWAPLKIAGRDVVRVNFEFRGLDYSAYSYGKAPVQCGGGRALLLIPGTGHNQSTAIYDNESDNYHYGARKIADAYGDSYFVFVKPNEDFLAWHDGTRKLGVNAYVNWHINNGGSYSYSYLVQSLAFMKFMRSCYSETAVAGLSQGGTAALLNSFQSGPDHAFIFSGYTVVRAIGNSGFNQFILNDVNRFLTPKAVKDYIVNGDTEYLFSWGRAEKGLYGIEVEGNNTCSYFSTLTNVSCISHAGGHVFSVEVAEQFLSNK